MRIVLDANVIIAALLTEGRCREVLRLAAGRHDAYVCPAILDEVAEKFATKLAAHADRVRSVSSELMPLVHVVEPAQVPGDCCRDPDDVHVLGTAAAASADLIVTGDDDLLVLKSFRGTRIIRPSDFVTIAASL